MNVDAEELAEQLRALEFERAERRPQARAAGAAAHGASTWLDRRGRPTNSLVISADAAIFAELSDVIGELDVIPPRIAIEAWVWYVETARVARPRLRRAAPDRPGRRPDDNVAFALLGRPGAADRSDLRRPPFVARFTRRPFLIPIIGPDGIPDDGGRAERRRADHRRAGATSRIRALTTPYLLAASGEEQHIFAGQNVPIPVSSVGRSVPRPRAPYDGANTAGPSRSRRRSSARTSASTCA